jgi:hypothetical protein
MPVFRRSKFQRRIVIPLMLVCFTAACHKWVPLEPPVEQALAEHNGKVRITLEGGRRVDFNSGRVAEEFWHGSAQRDTAFSSVAKAEVRKTNVVGMVGFLVGVVVGTVVLCEAGAFAC